jgi:hypothetical protein
VKIVRPKLLVGTTAKVTTEPPQGDEPIHCPTCKKATTVSRVQTHTDALGTLFEQTHGACGHLVTQRLLVVQGPTLRR